MLEGLSWGTVPCLGCAAQGQCQTGAEEKSSVIRGEGKNDRRVVFCKSDKVERKRVQGAVIKVCGKSMREAGFREQGSRGLICSEVRNSSVSLHNSWLSD